VKRNGNFNQAAAGEMEKRAMEGDGEAQALIVFAMMQDRTKPLCPGPVAIHVNAQFECHGGCECCAEAFHGPDDVFPCDHRVLGSVALYGECPRCHPKTE